MKKLIVLIALVAFVGMMAAPVTAAPVSVAVEEVKDAKKEVKDAKTTDTAACAEKSPCSATKTSDDTKAKEEKDK